MTTTQIALWNGFYDALQARREHIDRAGALGERGTFERHGSSPKDAP
jgi:hypothetical protein